MEALRQHFHSQEIDAVFATESRGFWFGTILAYELTVPFVPLRKPGKLPWKTLQEEFKLEYGKDAFGVHSDAINEGAHVLIFDDVLATGGTACAAGNLVKKLGGTITGYAFLIELEYLHGREKLKELTSNVFSLVKVVSDQ